MPHSSSGNKAVWSISEAGSGDGGWPGLPGCGPLPLWPSGLLGWQSLSTPASHGPSVRASFFFRTEQAHGLDLSVFRRPASSALRKCWLVRTHCLGSSPAFMVHWLNGLSDHFILTSLSFPCQVGQQHLYHPDCPTDL